jgi:predicted alpha/beta-hydrolase family hydrolase
MQAIADAFVRVGIATLRFDFPFMEAGRKRVDPPTVATAAIEAAFRHAQAQSGLPLFLAGHSFGGRMASHAVLDRGLHPKGLIYCSFPLHAAGKPSTKRAAHLALVSRPMLFLSGTRDRLAERDLLDPLLAELPHSELHLIDTADHGYAVLKRTRATTEGVYEEMGRVAREFVERNISAHS